MISTPILLRRRRWNRSIRFSSNHIPVNSGKFRNHIFHLTLLTLILFPFTVHGQEKDFFEANGKTVEIIPAEAARQGVAVGETHLYAITNSWIVQHDKETGKALRQWTLAEGENEIIHLDSGVVVEEKLYASHSNWPHWPMTSSIEVWDAESLTHLDSHSFGIQLGSLTWLDRHDGQWWGTFANYNRIQPGQQQPYGKRFKTQLVRMNDEFQIEEQWVLPEELLEKFETMSNSGGSWGPDDRLYITGHDLPEAYVLELPQAGSTLRWVGTILIPEIEGQGIAWDRIAETPTLYGIRRSTGSIIQIEMPQLPEKKKRAPYGVTKPIR